MGSDSQRQIGEKNREIVRVKWWGKGNGHGWVCHFLISCKKLYFLRDLLLLIYILTFTSLSPVNKNFHKQMGLSCYWLYSILRPIQASSDTTISNIQQFMMWIIQLLCGKTLRQYRKIENSAYVVPKMKGLGLPSTSLPIWLTRVFKTGLTQSPKQHRVLLWGWQADNR